MSDMSQMQAMKAVARPETEFVARTAKGEQMKFRLLHWSPTKVFSRIPLVGKYFYVPFSMLGSVTPQDEAFADALPAALIQLFNTMEENDLLVFLGTILDDVYYNNQPVTQTFDTTFLGKHEVVLQVVAKVLEVNYAPFFEIGFESLITSILPVVKLGNQD
jgi:hypothetical protein